MKEDEFIKKLEENGFLNCDNEEILVIPIYWTIDDKENVILDEECMKDEFDFQIKDLRRLLK